MTKYTSYQDRYFAEQLLLKRPQSSYDSLASAMSGVKVDLNPHQVDAALFAMQSPLSSGVLMADEVGLGKTIEAGLVLAQYWAERKRNILLIVPAALRTQWRSELSEKFYIDSLILESSNFNKMRKEGCLNPFDAKNQVVICSYNFAANKDSFVHAMPWDLVVLDEAHRLRNVYKPQNVTANKLKNALKGRKKLLLTASRNTPLNGVLSMSSGGKPVEGGYYIFTDDEKNAFLKKEPSAQTYFRKFVGSDDFINGYTRWCLWLHDVSPSDIRKLPECMKRVNSVHDYRLESKKAATRAAAATPMSFMEIKRPVGKFLIVPEVSSQRRKYVPLGFSDKEMICSNKVRFVSNATMYHFGILTSNVHMAWMRAVCGRLKSDYSYSINVVYNNFPWPTPTEQQKAKIEQTAKAILDARALYPDSSLADLYDDLTMPPELRKAHQANDRAVMDAYGFIKGTAARTSESACVAELMKLYQQKVSAAQSK